MTTKAEACQTLLQSHGIHGRLLKDLMTIVSKECSKPDVTLEEMFNRIEEHCCNSEHLSDQVEELLSDHEEANPTIAYNIIEELKWQLGMSMAEWVQEMADQEAWFNGAEDEWS